MVGGGGALKRVSGTDVGDQKHLRYTGIFHSINWSIYKKALVLNMARFLV